MKEEIRYPYYQSVYTTFHGPTNTRGYYISVLMDKGFGEVVKMNARYNDEGSDAHDNAIRQFITDQKMEHWKIIGKGHAPKGYVYLLEWQA